MGVAKCITLTPKGKYDDLLAQLVEAKALNMIKVS